MKIILVAVLASYVLIACAVLYGVYALGVYVGTN
jgi:hypothetical protein